ncbi:MAG: MMPL family transporter [Planctomycetota bacterium]|nr:MMPL family transporter [Planctomycetota bacterium]
MTRVDVVFRTDPFDRESIRLLNEVELQIRRSLAGPHDPEEAELIAPLTKAKFFFVGPTGSIRDLKTVTDGDQWKIDILVLGAVFLILLALLRKPGISIYLIVSVFFSYFAALGATIVVFWMWDPANFAGLDWKVPMFLFTILIAIGEDYNIFLMTRIDEEQHLHGPVEGIRVAMRKTGTIISSCGIIMAGTFLSLFAGTLIGLKQLGFALAFGVLLDTFVVRPLLVPAFLVLLYRGGFGRWGQAIGGPLVEGATPPDGTTTEKPPRT